jgi:single-stranded-DNA-specific exonuclease
LLDLRNQQNQTQIPENAFIFTNESENHAIMSEVLVIAETPNDADALAKLEKSLLNMTLQRFISKIKSSKPII